MLWVFLFFVWLLQLHFINAATWLGVSWPLFALIVLLISPKVNKYKLAWFLLFFGTLADISSYLVPGTVIKSYIILIVFIWLWPFLNMHLNKMKFAKLFKILALILLVDIAYLTLSTSVNSLFLSLSHEIIIISAMAAIVLGIISLAKNIVWGVYEKS